MESREKRAEKENIFWRKRFNVLKIKSRSHDDQYDYYLYTPISVFFQWKKNDPILIIILKL